MSNVASSSDITSSIGNVDVINWMTRADEILASGYLITRIVVFLLFILREHLRNHVRFGMGRDDIKQEADKNLLAYFKFCFSIADLQAWTCPAEQTIKSMIKDMEKFYEIHPYDGRQFNLDARLAHATSIFKKVKPCKKSFADLSMTSAQKEDAKTAEEEAKKKAVMSKKKKADQLKDTMKDDPPPPPLTRSRSSQLREEDKKRSHMDETTSAITDFCASSSSSGQSGFGLAGGGGGGGGREGELVIMKRQRDEHLVTISTLRNDLTTSQTQVRALETEKRTLKTEIQKLQAEINTLRYYAASAAAPPDGDGDDEENDEESEFFDSDGGISSRMQMTGL
jgi:hypothetical protein